MATIWSLVGSMEAQWLRHEVLANNLANLSTPGFKADDLIIGGGGGEGGGPGALLPAEPPTVSQWTDFAPGILRETGRPLDVALSGPGFLAVQTPAGERYTRGGALGLDAQGYLVTAGGHRVLGTGGPIPAGGPGGAPGSVQVGPGGEIVRGGQTVGTLRVVDFPRPYRLVKEGGGLYAPAPGVAPVAAAGAAVTGGALEASNVNAIETMVAMIDLFRRYEAAQRALQALDESSQQATAEIGQV